MSEFATRQAAAAAALPHVRTLVAYASGHVDCFWYDHLCCTLAVFDAEAHGDPENGNDKDRALAALRELRQNHAALFADSSTLDVLEKVEEEILDDDT